MADLPEDDGWVEGVRAIEETDPVRFDIYNESLSALASRTKYLQENPGSGSGTGTPIEWLDGLGVFPGIPEESGAPVPIPIGLMEPGKHYILDNRSNYLYGIIVHSDDEIEEIQSAFECISGGSLDLKEIPVGSEFHFTLAGDPEETFIDWWGMWDDVL